MISGVRGDVAVKIFGPDIAMFDEIANKLSAILSGIDGAEDVYTTPQRGRAILYGLGEPAGAPL